MLFTNCYLHVLGIIGANALGGQKAVRWFMRLSATLTSRRPAFKSQASSCGIWWSECNWDRFLSDHCEFTPLSIAPPIPGMELGPPRWKTGPSLRQNKTLLNCTSVCVQSQVVPRRQRLVYIGSTSNVGTVGSLVGDAALRAQNRHHAWDWLTVHRSMTLVNFQLDAQILIYLYIIHLLKSSTCFEHCPAHLQEVHVLTL